MVDGKSELDRTKCTACFKCCEVCPTGARKKMGSTVSVDASFTEHGGTEVVAEGTIEATC